MPIAGSGDLCLLTEEAVDDVVAVLRRKDIEIEAGPLRRDGAAGALESVYVRDPDGNLVEIARPGAAS